MAAKYIKTSSGQIVVFSKALSHSNFKYLEPVSAGFIIFGVDENDTVCVKCYGESVTLQLKADEDDSHFANVQFFNNFL